MRYAVAQRRGKVLNIKVLDSRMKIIVETEGYECVSMSSRPPYGPHIRHHGARIWGMYNADLKNVKVINGEIDRKLERIETTIENLKKEHRLLLTSKWRAFRPAALRDFNPKSIVKAKTKIEAEKEMPDKAERQKLAKRGKRMGAMLNSITNKVFKR